MRRLGVYKYGKPNREDDEVIGMLDAHTVYMNYAFVGSCLWSYTFDERGECTAKTSLTNDLSVFFAEDNTCINDRPNKVSYEFYDLHALARVLYVIYSCE